jgi:hypothetical protein
VGSGQREHNGLKNAVQLSFHFAIREAQDFIATLPQFLIADAIATAVLVEPMLVAVDLDDDPRAATFKVNDVGR